MKKILFIRHAKSDWGNSFLKDHDRPLNNRGEKDAKKMGARLKKKEIYPELFISSSASRALQTCQIIKEELNSTSNTEINSNIYSNGIDGILDSIYSVNDKINFLVFFGHNPTMHNIANQISKEPIHKFPTCSCILASCNIENWRSFHFNDLSVLMHDYPKK